MYYFKRYLTKQKWMPSITRYFKSLKHQEILKCITVPLECRTWKVSHRCQSHKLSDHGPQTPGLPQWWPAVEPVIMTHSAKSQDYIKLVLCVFLLWSMKISADSTTSLPSKAKMQTAMLYYIYSKYKSAKFSIMDIFMANYIYSMVNITTVFCIPFSLLHEPMGTLCLLP